MESIRKKEREPRENLPLAPSQRDKSNQSCLGAKNELPA
jgi:hypothetical protein